MDYAKEGKKRAQLRDNRGEKCVIPAGTLLVVEEYRNRRGCIVGVWRTLQKVYGSVEHDAGSTFNTWVEKGWVVREPSLLLEIHPGNSETLFTTANVFSTVG